MPGGAAGGGLGLGAIVIVLLISWMTGADPALFVELEGRADIIKIADGRIVAPNGD